MSEKKMLQGIASILEETLPEDWSKVVFYAEYAEGAFSIEYYVAGSGKDDFVKCFDQKGVSRASLMKIFMAINKFIEPERAALKPEKRWGSMTLILHSNGKFKVDYDYSDMTENAYARKKAWKRNISPSNERSGKSPQSHPCILFERTRRRQRFDQRVFGSHANPCSTFLGSDCSL